MRVYELSKQLGVPAKKLLELLDKEGIKVKSHMSSIGEESVALLQNVFGPKKKSKKPASEQEDKKVMQTQPTKKQGEKLQPVQSTILPSPTVKAETKPIHKAKKESVVEGIIIESMSVSDVAQKLGQQINDIIMVLLSWGVVAAKNKLIPEATVERLARHYGVEILKSREPVGIGELVSLAVEGVGELEERLPIIVVLGHVDHGKTTLLDFIRKTRVVAKEKGGITQHLGAYEATTDHGNIIFLDTPGHEAFPKMRQRGVRVADIGVLVIAADDGIMPQTIEAINYLKTMKIPIVVAINKIDKADAVRIETVKRQLAEQDLLPEEWGGQTVCIPISALKGQGIDQLLEMIVLQAQLLELRAVHKGVARGFVLESKLERGRGPVATLILQHGTLQIGDYFICGKTGGRVSSIRDSFGKNMPHVGPSIPVQVAGFNELPEVGYLLLVVSKEELRREKQQRGQASFVARASSEGEINIIIKADTNSSKEALVDAIYKLFKKSAIGFNIVYVGVGDISESDIELAYNTSSDVIGLHVKAETNARSLARRRDVSIRRYDIIYKLLEALEEQAEKEKPVETVQTKIGEAVVRRVFDIKGVGIVAGSYVQDGKFSNKGHVVVWRGRQKVGEGPITSLQREKKTVKEVHAGYECGFVIEGMTDWEVDDRVECFVDLPK